jgi:hypothetical protein
MPLPEPELLSISSDQQSDAGLVALNVPDDPYDVPETTMPPVVDPVITALPEPVALNDVTAVPKLAAPG